MDWGLAGYDSHPIDGEASQISACADRLGQVAENIRAQITRLRGIDSADIWMSSAGSAEAFQQVVEDLPDKLELVATRYEKAHEALSGFHPTLASTKQDAEYWIQKAETAHNEVERTQAGKEEQEDFQDNAEDGQQWEGEDYGASNEAAEGDLQTAIDNVKNAVSTFESAANSAAEDINNAANDDLKNGWSFLGIDSWDDVLDILEVVVDVLSVIGTILAVVCMFVPGLNLIAFAVAAAVFLGTFVLYLNDRKSGWDLAFAAVGLVLSGVGFVAAGYSSMLKGGKFLTMLKLGQGTDELAAGSRIAIHAARLDAIDGLSGFAGLVWEPTQKLFDTKNGGAFNIDGIVQNPMPSTTDPGVGWPWTSGDTTATNRPTVDVGSQDLTQTAYADVPGGN